VPSSPYQPVDLLENDGFVVLGSFLDGREVDLVRGEVERLLANPLPPGRERPHNTLAALRWNDAIVEPVLASNARMDRLGEALDAEDLRWISAYVSVKPPRSDALWWHQDWWCWDHPVTYRRGAPQVAVLCYLSETSPSRGALRVLPGSHRASVPLHELLPEAHSPEADQDTPARLAAMSDCAGQVTLSVRAGDAVVVDYRLLHGTHPNLGDQRRDCLLLTFAPAWRRLPVEIRAHLIRHPAQPTSRRRAPQPWRRRLLPRFDGTPRDLRLNRVAPTAFAVDRGS
jgi:hypothetical protein